jgi:hypothetical protein
MNDDKNGDILPQAFDKRGHRAIGFQQMHLLRVRQPDWLRAALEMRRVQSILFNLNPTVDEEHLQATHPGTLEITALFISMTGRHRRIAMRQQPAKATNLAIIG